MFDVADIAWLPARYHIAPDGDVVPPWAGLALNITSYSVVHVAVVVLGPSIVIVIVWVLPDASPLQPANTYRTPVAPGVVVEATDACAVLPAT